MKSTVSRRVNTAPRPLTPAGITGNGGRIGGSVSKRANCSAIVVGDGSDMVRLDSQVEKFKRTAAIGPALPRLKIELSRVLVKEV